MGIGELIIQGIFAESQMRIRFYEAWGIKEEEKN